MNLRNIFSLLALCLALSGCAIFHDALDHNGAKVPEADPSLEQSVEAEAVHSPRAVSTQFEWAVQYYEAGQYEQAITSFRRLEKQGATIAAFELIPFYLGMSFKNLLLEEKAIPYLEKFVIASPDIFRAQEARMALLLCYEATKNWKKISSTAAEMEKFTLYTENQSLLNLLWSEALLEQGEFLGAKQKLTEAASIINNLPLASSDTDNREINPASEDLFGRYVWTNTRIQLASCENLHPKEMQRKQKVKKYFLETWIDAKAACVKKTYEIGTENFSTLSPQWAKAVLKELTSGANFIDAIPEWLVNNRYFPTAKEARSANLQKIRLSLYTLSNHISDHIKNFQHQSLNREHLNELLKHIEHLIYQLSLPSS